MENHIDSITEKVNAYFEKITKENKLQIPSLLYTYSKQINIREQGSDIITDTETILNNINNTIEKENNVIVLDSSYNPPTLAHIKLLTETFHSYCEQELSGKNDVNFSNPTFLLLITNNNVDKKVVGANIPQRLQMLEIVANIFQNQITSLLNDQFSHLKNKIKQINILVGLTNVGRFIDKAIAIRQSIPKASAAFIMGWDTITRFFMEKYYVGLDMKAILDGFFSENSIICADRIMYEGGDHHTNDKTESKKSNELDQFIAEGPAKPYKDKIFILKKWLEDKQVSKISSSEARHVLKEDYNNLEKLKTILPEEIISFILQYNIYN